MASPGSKAIGWGTCTTAGSGTVSTLRCGNHPSQQVVLGPFKSTDGDPPHRLWPVATLKPAYWVLDADWF